jgi:peptidoglycan/xylan/chitin deacetylase (PgdA/CDA1 family)
MWHMPRHQPKVALTFDDGPDDTITPALLSVLQQKKVKATFFLVGHMVAKFPHVVQRIVNDGHEIANHTWAHYRLDEMTQHQVSLQLSATTAAFQQMGIPMKPYIRPPGGRFNNYVIHAAKDQDLTMVMWDVNAADYKDANGSLPSVAAIQNRVLRQVRPGSIVLMHNSTATVQALPGIIDALIQKNYQLGVLKW